MRTSKPRTITTGPRRGRGGILFAEPDYTGYGRFKWVAPDGSKIQPPLWRIITNELYSFTWDWFPTNNLDGTWSCTLIASVDRHCVTTYTLGPVTGTFWTTNYYTSVTFPAENEANIFGWSFDTSSAGAVQETWFADDLNYTGSDGRASGVRQAGASGREHYGLFVAH